MFSAKLLSLALLVTGALAVPSSKSRLSDRIARRAGGPHLSRPLQPVEGGITSSGNTSHVSYSSNWSGAVLSEAAGTWKSVTASFTVPKPSGSNGAAASAWVGIDGDTCGNAIWQTGVDFNVGSSNSVSFDAWYEWYPDYAYDFSGISFSVGDSVTLTVTATSTTSGTAVITNNTKNKSVSKTLSSSSALCQQDAEWIVEDFEEGSSLVPLANFGTVAFTGSSATTNSGSSVGPAGATIIDIKQGSTVYTSVSISGSTVTDKYV